MNKKILILFVRRGYLEIEYILPVLKILKKNIIFLLILKNKKHINHYKDKKMYMMNGQKLILIIIF